MPSANACRAGWALEFILRCRPLQTAARCSFKSLKLNRRGASRGHPTKIVSRFQ